MNVRPVLARSVTSEIQSTGNTNEETVYWFSLRVAVLSHSLLSKVSEGPHHATITGNIVGSTDGSFKFPKDATKTLKEHLQLAWMGKDPRVNDNAIKASLANFYNIYIEDHFYRQVRENRKVEELILIFVSCATKELQKRSPQKPIDHSEINAQVASFIQLVEETLEEYIIHSGVPEIITQLRSWILKINQSQMSTLSSNSDHRGFYVNDMPLVKALGHLFTKTHRQLQEDVKSIVVYQLRHEASSYLQNRLEKAKDGDSILQKDANELNKSTDIEQISSRLNNLPVTSSSKLMSPNSCQTAQILVPSFDKLVSNTVSVSANQSRLTSMQSFAMNRNSVLNSLDLRAPTPISNGLPKSDPNFAYSFIPSVCQDAIAYLLRLSILQNDGAPPARDQEELILECCFWWNISEVELNSIIMKLLCDLYDIGKLGTSEVIQYLSTFATNTKMYSTRNREAFTKQLSALYELTLKALTESLKVIFKVNKRSVLDPLDLFKFIRSHPLFDETLNTRLPHFEEIIGQSGGNLYATWNVDFPTEVEPIHISDIIQKMLKTFAKTRQKYNNTILNDLNITALLIESQMPLFTKDLEHMVNCLKKNSVTSESVMNDVFTVYGEVVELNKLCCTYAARKQVDVSAYFTAYVSEWLQLTDGKISSWVQNAILQDTFVSTDEHTKHSNSVFDIFMSIRQAFEFIKNLEWNNEYQNARFITMLSRTFSSAISYYCEVLKEEFSKTSYLPGSLSVDSNPTERWLAIAKGAIGKREKLEPFVFSIDNCVRLNNIEYSRKELDLLEKDMKTDVISTILRNHGFDNISKQGVLRYTIKVVEAEDVVSTNSTLQKSYVTMNDDDGRRLHRTRTVYATSDPRWEETFDVSAKKNLFLRCRVWHENRNNEKHDLAGGCSLKLDATLYKDLIPRQFWVDLDTGGRLLFRIHMEGERDDIHFYFGRAFQTLTRTEKEMIRLIVDKLAPNIRDFISTSTLRNVVGENMRQSVSRLLSSTGIGKVQTSKSILTASDIEDSIQGLLNLFNDTFLTLNDNLTRSSLVKVMVKVWKEVLISIEACVLPSLSDKPSTKLPLSEKEFDIVYRWLRILYDFFYAEGDGVPRDILHSSKYSDICSIAMFYFDSTESLIERCEEVASGYFRGPQERPARSSGGMLLYRQKTVMHHQNLGTIKQRKQSKSKIPLQPTDDLWLRILRMRPCTEKFLRDRFKQKSRLAAAVAAEDSVKNPISQRHH